MKKLLLLLALALLTACATAGQPGSTGTPQNFFVQVPDQWTRLNVPDCFMCSKEGPFEQYIYVQQRHVSKEFPNAKKTLVPGMKPKQIADVIVQELSSDPDVLDLRIMERGLAKVNQYDGFKMLFTYRVKDGYSFKTLLYGFVHGDWYYAIRYNADVGKFSAEDIRVFEKIVKTFALKDASGLAYSPTK
jgi:hypothetical protein